MRNFLKNLDLKKNRLFIYVYFLGALYTLLLFLSIRKNGFDLFDINFYLMITFYIAFELVFVNLQTFIEKKFEEKEKKFDLILSAGMIISIISAGILNISNAMLLPLISFLFLKPKVLFSKKYHFFVFNTSMIGLLIFIASKLFHWGSFIMKNILLSSLFVVVLSIFYTFFNFSFVFLFLYFFYNGSFKACVRQVFGEGRFFNSIFTSLNIFVVYFLYRLVGVSAIPITFFTIVSVQLGNYYATKYRNAKVDFLTVLTKSLEEKDSYTFGHGENVSKLAVKVAKELGFPDKDLKLIEIAGILHDVGKIGIPDIILLKTDKLSFEEYEIMKEHSKKGYEILKNITEYKDTIAKWVLHHHERWDGKGYPDGLSKEDIPVVSRILTICDVFDALTSDRPYRKAWEKERAILFIEENSGVIFDPKIVKIFLSLVRSEY
ncbi:MULTISPECIES: HD-GYP domain-containing protein [unclassified Thermosipho (in: thermotogales)]|uniref:HD-GYP domain-containing protein n=1 Tax=unclassified Thermosipho (in: thermotogales) TaxID=2676525 RepID=UPI000984A9E3|nr:HD-GYP domain-containing protein [Thermosipho sp. 1223]MBT1248062.1 phosphohydrolase [Thermosipho sp. 1244]OOC46655.1 phosphohydrolase [Thermosipho sp. 1223]